MRRLVSVLALGFIIAGAIPARADDTIGESLDWLFTNRASVAVETVTATIPLPAKPGVNPQITIQTTLKTALKGQPPQQASFVRRWQAKGVAGQDDTARPADGTDYLLFFDEHGVITNAINLSFPSSKVGFGADPNDVALADDFSIIKSGALVMEAVYARMEWLKDHPPPQAASGGASSQAVPEGAVQIAVPMTSPAWDVLYTGAGQCLLRIPADIKEQNAREQTNRHKIEFTAPVTDRDCSLLPEAPFRIRSATAGAAHTLTLACGANKDERYDTPVAMTMSYTLVGDLRDGDYNFEWGADPDNPDDPHGFFTGHEKMCNEMASTLKFRLPSQIKIPPATADAKPKYASWTAECVSSDVWQFVLGFQLSIRATSEDAAAAAARPLAAVSSAVGAHAVSSDIILLLPPSSKKPAAPALAPVPAPAP